MTALKFIIYSFIAKIKEVIKRTKMEEIRLQKYLANQGIASRRKCEEYIENGLIEVNGKIVYELGTKIIPEKDVVKFKGKLVENKENRHVYILLNKPIRICDNSKRPI